jgi:serine/threonine protein kinase
VLVSLPSVGSIVAGKYRVEALLGEGGMGAVFRARHELMDKSVALKWLHPRLWVHAEAKERFLREARIVSRIRHPNVVEVFDICVQHDALFMVMELLEGENLELLLQRGTLSVQSALALILEAMRGVAAAHARGIIHRDIKPENIFVGRGEASEAPRQVAKILDFGISKLVQDGIGNEQMTKTGMTMGTPAYMSFEHISGARDVDARTDVYSFGVLLYRLLTDELPYGSDSFANVAVRLATTRAVAPRVLRPQLPTALSELVMKAMAFEREHRHQSMDALIEALARVCSQCSLSLPTQSTTALGDGPLTSAPVATSPPSSAHARSRESPSRTLPSRVWLAPVALLTALGLWGLLAESRDSDQLPGQSDTQQRPAAARLNDAAAAPALSPPPKQRAGKLLDPAQSDDGQSDWEPRAREPHEREVGEPIRPEPAVISAPLNPATPIDMPQLDQSAANARPSRKHALPAADAGTARVKQTQPARPPSLRIGREQF